MCHPSWQMRSLPVINTVRLCGRYEACLWSALSVPVADTKPAFGQHCQTLWPIRSPPLVGVVSRRGRYESGQHWKPPWPIQNLPAVSVVSPCADTKPALFSVVQSLWPIRSPPLISVVSKRGRYEACLWSVLSVPAAGMNLVSTVIPHGRYKTCLWSALSVPVADTKPAYGQRCQSPWPIRSLPMVSIVTQAVVSLIQRGDLQVNYSWDKASADQTGVVTVASIGSNYDNKPSFVRGTGWIG